jgi:hypothetical protein
MKRQRVETLKERKMLRISREQRAARPSSYVFERILGI